MRTYLQRTNMLGRSRLDSKRAYLSVYSRIVVHSPAIGGVYYMNTTTSSSPYSFIT